MAKPPLKAPAQTDDQKLAGYWIGEITTSEKWQADYWTRCRRIIRRYKQDTYRQNETVQFTDRRYAILWSNIATLGPAVYARTPQPAVGRRFKDQDPIGRQASEVIERALTFSIEQYDFDARMIQARDDYLLLARGQAWVRYVPPEQAGSEDEVGDGQVTSSKDGEGAADNVPYEEAVCDHVSFGDWGLQPCRSWDDTAYVWRCVFMTRPELVKRFGEEIGNAVPLDWRPAKDEPGTDLEVRERQKKAAIYEIWDKTSGQAYWICKSWPAQCLDVRPDPLGLTEFFPCPRPLMGTTPQDNYIPIPDYVYYQDQAEELDELTQRIGTLTDALKLVGVYASEYGVALQNMFQGANNQMIPIESMAVLADKGGLRGIIEWFPVAMVIETLQGCFETRKQILDDIYQITGISDILRGASNPNETATAQGIKTQWGSLRVRDRQRDMQRFARDILRLKAQIIASKFSVETLKAMTNVKMLTQAEKQQIQIAQKLDQQSAQQYQQAMAQFQASQQQAAPQAPQPGSNVTAFPGHPPQPMAPVQAMQPPQQPQQILPHVLSKLQPDALDLMSEPTWDEVTNLLHSNGLRDFRIDVETDSTIEPDQQDEKQSRVEFLTTLGQFMAGAIPLVQQIPQLAPLMSKSIEFLTRGYRVGAEMEDIINKTFDQLAQMPAQTTPGADKGAQGADPQELQIKAAQVQNSAQASNQTAQLKQAEIALDAQKLQGQQQLDQARLAVEQQQLATEQQRTVSTHQLGMGDLELRAAEQRAVQQQFAAPQNRGIG